MVVGSGAGGGVAAWALAQSRRSVLLMSGRLPGHGPPGSDHLRNAEPTADWTTGRCGRRRTIRALLLTPDAVVVPAWDPRYGSNADTFGGGTRVYGAQAWRFCQKTSDGDTYGVPDGSALADWPVSYDDMEPFYTQAEYNIGVCGSATPRRMDRTFAALSHVADGGHRACRLLLEGASSWVGLTTVPVPLAINPHRTMVGPRAPGAANASASPAPAKNGSENTVISQAAATGTSASCSRPVPSALSRTPPAVSPASISWATSAVPVGVAPWPPRTWSSPRGPSSPPGSC